MSLISTEQDMVEADRPNSQVALRSLRGRLMRGGGWAAFGKAVTTGATLAINALVARILTPEEVGAYFLAFSVTALLAMAAQFGLGQVVVRFVAESLALQEGARARRIIRRVFQVGALTAILTGVLAASTPGRFIAAEVFDSTVLLGVMGIVGVWVFVLTIQSLLAETFRGFQDIRGAAIFGGAGTGALTAVGLGAFWALRGQATLSEVLLISIAGGALSGLLGAAALRYKIGKLPRARSTVRGEDALLSVAWPLWLTTLLMFSLTQADLWILGAMRSDQDVALYGAAARLAAATKLASALLYAVLPPVISELHGRGELLRLERVLRVSAMANLLAVLPIFLLFFLAPTWILQVVFGPTYGAASPVLILLTVGILVNVTTGVRGYVLMMVGHEKLQLKLSLIGGVFAVGLCYLGAVLSGPVGVAWGAMTAMVIQCIIELGAVRTTLGIWTQASPRLALSEARSLWART